MTEGIHRINDFIKQVPNLKYDASVGNFECDRRALYDLAVLIVRDCMKTAQSVSELRGVTEEHIYGADTACVLISKRYEVEL